jgi:hypothetical protein
MSFYIPSDITNIIFDYYAQLKDLKWKPFIDGKTGKLKWKINKYSAKYDTLNKLMKHKKDNLPDDVSFDIDVLRDDGERIYTYNAIGTSIYLKTEYYVNCFKASIPVSNLYIQFTDDFGFKHSLFCSICGRSSLRRFDFDVYQDGTIHSILIDIIRVNINAYSLVI